jgi:hypothetical protein
VRSQAAVISASAAWSEKAGSGAAQPSAASASVSSAGLRILLARAAPGGDGGQRGVDFHHHLAGLRQRVDRPNGDLARQAVQQAHAAQRSFAHLRRAHQVEIAGGRAAHRGLRVFGHAHPPAPRRKQIARAAPMAAEMPREFG